MRPAQACFAEYAEQAGALPEVAEFCHVRPATVLTWQDGTWPRGEPLYLLWAFLEFKGFSPAELAELPKPSRQLLLIIAMGELSFEKVQKELNYQNLQGVYRLFRQGGGLTKQRAWKLEALVSEYLPALDLYRMKFTGVASGHSTEKSLGSVAVRSASELPPSSPEVTEQSSLARLLRLAVKRAGEVDPQELKRQLRDVPATELEEFALLLLEIV